jgi:iron(III) transport system permease protein
VLVFLAVLAVYPLLNLVKGLFWVDGVFTFDGIVKTVTLPGLGQTILNTIILVLASSLIAMIIGSALAWVNERTNARIGMFSEIMPLLPFLLPPVAGAVGWVMLLAPSGGYLNYWLRSMMNAFGAHLEEGPLTIYSWYGLIGVFAIYQIPYVFLMMTASLRNIDPALEEQARVCGDSALKTFVRVTLPGAKVGLLGAALLLVWNGFSLFSVPRIIGTGADINVLSVTIVHLLNGQYPPQTQSAIGLSIIVLIFVGLAWLVQRWLLAGNHYATIGGKAQTSTLLDLRGWRRPVQGLVWLYLFLVTVLPVMSLILVSMSGYWNPAVSWGDLSVGAIFDNLSANTAIADALKNSLLLGLTGASLGLLLAALISVGSVKARSWLRRVGNAAIKLPASVSHIVIAVGFILAFAGPPFRLGSTIVILLLAYLVLWMPQALVSTDAAVKSVGHELIDASHVFGASATRTFGRIYLPLMASGVAAGWAIVFVHIFGDLNASALLSGTGNPVIGAKLLEIYSFGSYGQLASLSLVLVLVSATVVSFMHVAARRIGPANRGRRTRAADLPTRAVIQTENGVLL